MRSHFYFVRCLFPRSGRCTPRSRQRSSVVLLPLSISQWKGIIPIILPLSPPPSSHKKGNIPDNYHTFSHTFLLTYLWGKNPWRHRIFPPTIRTTWSKAYKFGVSKPGHSLRRGSSREDVLYIRFQTQRRGDGLCTEPLCQEGFTRSVEQNKEHCQTGSGKNPYESSSVGGSSDVLMTVKNISPPSVLEIRRCGSIQSTPTLPPDMPVSVSGQSFSRAQTWRIWQDPDLSTPRLETKSPVFPAVGL